MIRRCHDAVYGDEPLDACHFTLLMLRCLRVYAADASSIDTALVFCCYIMPARMSGGRPLRSFVYFRADATMPPMPPLSRFASRCRRSCRYRTFRYYAHCR